MKFLIAFVAIVAVAIAAPPASDDRSASIVRSTNDNQPDGAYAYS